MLRTLLAMAFLCLAFIGGDAHAQSTAPVILPSGCGTANLYAGTGYVTIDSTGRLCMSGAGSISGNVSNGVASVAATSTNVPTVAYNFNANDSAGGTWSPQQGLLIGVAGAPATDVVTVQGPILGGDYPTGSTPISGNATGAAAGATGTLAAAASKTTYICGFSVNGLTGSATVSVTVTGLLGGTKSYLLSYGSTATQVGDSWKPCLPASAQNTAINVVAAAAAAATITNVNSNGYQQ